MKSVINHGEKMNVKIGNEINTGDFCKRAFFILAFCVLLGGGGVLFVDYPLYGLEGAFFRAMAAAIGGWILGGLAAVLAWGFCRVLKLGWNRSTYIIVWVITSAMGLINIIYVSVANATEFF